MQSKFQTAVKALLLTNLQFKVGDMSSVHHGSQRGVHIATALRELALEFGCNLDGPMFIDSNGDFRIVALGETFAERRYGKQFAACLNEHSPRCGAFPGAHMTEDSSWCYLNHFSAERLVIQHYEASIKDANPE